MTIKQVLSVVIIGKFAHYYKLLIYILGTLATLYTQAKSKNLQKLLLNGLNLMLSQGINFLFALLLMPYLIAKIGIANFGLIAFSQAIISYLIIFTEYGFYASATQSLIINRDDKNQLSKIFGQVYVSRLLLVVVGALVLTALCAIVPELRKYALLYSFTFVMVIGKSVFPLWFFQGIERMGLVAFFNLIAKSLIIGLIIWHVRTPEDYLYVNLFLGIGEVVTGILSLILIFGIWHYPLIMPSVADIKNQLYGGWQLFITNFAINIYVNSNVVILGLFVSKEIVGYYSVAERILGACRQILMVAFQSVYPRVCLLAWQDKNALKLFLRRLFYFYLVCNLVAGTLLFVFADSIVHLIAVQDADLSIKVLRWFSFIPLVMSINTPAYMFLLANKIKNGYLVPSLIGSLLNIVINFLLVPTIGVNGSITAIWLTEIFIAISLNLIVFRRKEDNFLF